MNYKLTKAQIAECRKAFDEWCKTNLDKTAKVPDDVKGFIVDGLWSGWQAAWNLRTPAEAMSQGVFLPVKTVARILDDYKWSEKGIEDIQVELKKALQLPAPQPVSTEAFAELEWDYPGNGSLPVAQVVITEDCTPETHPEGTLLYLSSRPPVPSVVVVPSVAELARWLHDTQQAPFPMPSQLTFEDLTEEGLAGWLSQAEAIRTHLLTRQPDMTAVLEAITPIIKKALETSEKHGRDVADAGRGKSWTTPWPGYNRYHLSWTMDEILKALATIKGV